MVVPVGVLSIGQIDLFENYSNSIGICENITVCKQMIFIRQNCECYVGILEIIWYDIELHLMGQLQFAECRVLLHYHCPH